MSPRQAFASALHLFVVFAFFGAGLFFVSLPYLPATRVQMIDLLSNQFEKCTTLGVGLFIASIFLLFGFYLLDRGRYLVLQRGVSTDIKIVRQTIEDLFSRHFPKKLFLKEIGIGSKSRLELNVELVPLDEFAREELFVKVEKELSALLKERFGYSQDFSLIVSV